jgi:O-antigen/teichoic acid export membrane protein
MKIERTRNAVVNTIFGWFNTALMILFPFVIRMIIIHTIGIEYLGLNSLFTSILRILNLSELGVGSAIVYSMYKPIACDNHDQICALLALYQKIYRIIGFVILTVGLLLIPFLPKLINGEPPADYNLYVLYLIYLANTVLSYWLFAYRSSLLNAHQNTAILSKVNIVGNLVMYVLQIAMLTLTKNYYLYVLAIPVSTIIINLLNAYLTIKKYPQYVCKGSVDAGTISGIKKRVTGLMFDKVAMASRNAFDSVIASAFFGLQVVAIYNNYYEIIAAITSVLSVLLNSIAAGIGNSLVVESNEKNENDMNSINFLFLSISGFCFACLLTLYQPFMSLWMGKENVFPTYIMMTFSFYFLSQKAESIIGRYYDAAGLWWHGKWKGVIEAATNLLLNIVLGKLFGVIGIVAATIISMLVVALPLSAHFVYKHVYNKSPKHFLVTQYMYIALLGVIGFLTYFGCESTIVIFGIHNLILEIVLKIPITMIFYSIIYLIVFSWQPHFKASREWLVAHIRIIRK